MDFLEPNHYFQLAFQPLLSLATIPYSTSPVPLDSGPPTQVRELHGLQASASASSPPPLVLPSGPGTTHQLLRACSSPGHSCTEQVVSTYSVPGSEDIGVGKTDHAPGITGEHAIPGWISFPGLPHKISISWGLRTIEVYSLTVLEARSLK